MEIAGLAVPDVVLRAAYAELSIANDGLRPHDGVDAYGHPLTLSLAQIYHESADVIRATIRLAIGFEADDWYGARTPESPGAIADVVDFSRVLCIGSSTEGEPFCFDFRDDPEHPSVICWDGDALSWRRIAPDAETFLRIFTRSLPISQPQMPLDGVQ
jgi:hypothetical protein